MRDSDIDSLSADGAQEPAPQQRTGPVPPLAPELTFVEEADLMGERLPQTPTARRLLNEFRDYGWIDDFLAIEAEAAEQSGPLADDVSPARPADTALLDIEGVLVRAHLEGWTYRRTSKAIAALASQPSSSEPADTALRPEVAAFAALMEKTLRENDHKGGWKQETGAWLLGRLREEVEELENAGVDPERKGREAADVANFAMMIADVTGSLRAALASQSSSSEPDPEPEVEP